MRWKYSPNGWFVLNTDGAAKGSLGPAGGGAIIRDESGNFILAITANFGHCSAFKAEFMALARWLDIAYELQITKLEIQLDNMACVQLLQNKAMGRSECAHIINHCRKLIEKPNWTIKVCHVYRQGNRAADWLANQGVLQDIRISFIDHIPLALYRILMEDIRGVSTTRLIPT